MKLMRNPLFYTVLCALVMVGLIWGRGLAQHRLGLYNWMDTPLLHTMTLCGMALAASAVTAVVRALTAFMMPIKGWRRWS